MLHTGCWYGLLIAVFFGAPDEKSWNPETLEKLRDIYCRFCDNIPPSFHFQTDTLRIIWAYHAMDPPATLKIPKHQKRGAKSVLMFSAPFELVNKSVPLEPDQTIVSILMEPPVC